MTANKPRAERNPGGIQANKAEPANDADELIPLRGSALRIVENMQASLDLPTATSYRSIPVKLLEENRRILNNHMNWTHRPRVSYTNLIAWAIVVALREFPSLNSCYEIVGEEAHKRMRKSVNLGVAVDTERRDGSRTLLVPCVKDTQLLTFRGFLEAYNSLIEKVRHGTLSPDDFKDTSVTLTNPGTVGTVASLPRLMPGQGAIVATGAIGYPAEYYAWSAEALSRMGLSKTMQVSCTYDHRVIQGAESGQFLGRVQDLLLGSARFYEEVFAELEIPEVPIHWSLDQSPALAPSPANSEELEKQIGVLKMINLL